MLFLIPSIQKELKLLHKMSQQKHVTPYLNPKPLVRYEEEFLDESFTYFNIMNNDKILVGYVLLFNTHGKRCIQLKRIVVDEKHLGIGKEVFVLVEEYCLEKVGVQCLCLDVYSDNLRAIDLYEKLGYVRCVEGIENGRKVWFYEKELFLSNLIGIT